MEQTYIKKVKINKVRHLSQIEIPVSEEKMKHLIITGKNGSGKTSLLNAISRFIDSLTTNKNLSDAIDYIEKRQGRNNAALLSIIEQKKKIVDNASKGLTEKAEKIRLWFDGFQNLLRKIFDDDSLQLKCIQLQNEQEKS